MIYGGIIERDCSSCKKSNAQQFHACGYIPKEEREENITVIPEFNDITMKTDICPLWHYLTDIHYYHFINVAKTIPLHQLTFLGRAVMESYNNYMNLRNSKKKG